MGPQLKVVERTRTATMLCAASGNPDPEIFWFKDFLPVEIDSGNGRIKQLRSGKVSFCTVPALVLHSLSGALQIENSEESDQGKYECVAVNRAGTRYSAPANLYFPFVPAVRRVPPRFSIPPTSQEVMPGGSVNLTCVAVGAPMPYVRWVSGEAELTQEDKMPVGRNVLELTNIHQSANYTCVATSSLGTIETTAQVFVRALPRMPTSLIVTETTATSVTLTWDSGNSDPVPYYVIQYHSKLSENGFQEVNGVATTRYSIGGLSPFSEYEFRVMAVNNIGRGPPSSLVHTRTSEQAPSSPPLHVQARVLSPSTMLVRWDPPEEPNGQIQGYRVYYSSEPSDPLSTWQIHNTDNSQFTTISGLKTGLTYSLRVLGFTSVGDGPPSEVLRLKAQAGVPAQPDGFEAETELDTRIRLSWLWPVQDPVHRVSLDAAGSYALDGLKPDTSYGFSLAAQSEMGVGVFTEPIEARTTQSMTGAPPRKVEAEALNSSAIRVSWMPPLSVKQQGPVLGYHLICSRMENGQPHGQPILLDVPVYEAQEALITGLLPETTYSVTVAAYTSKGDGARSKVRQVTTSGAVPGKPSMMISTMMGNMALIQWQPPKEMVGELVGFQLQYRRADEDAFTVKDFKKTDDHFAVTGLHKGATYTFKLSAKNRAGVGEEHVKEISTPEDVPSSYPQNLSVVGLGSSSARLTWEPPPTADRNGRIVRYVIVYRDINSPNNSSNSTTETQMTLQGLQPETTYDIRVQAFTSKGGGPISPSIQIRTSPTSMPVFAKNFGVQAVMKTSVLLTWDLPDSYEPQVPLKILYNQQSVEVEGDQKRKLITQLQPDTEYSFVLMSRGNGAGAIQQQVSIRTAPDLLNFKPALYPSDVEEDGQVVIALPQVPAAAAPARWFYVVVVPETAGSPQRNPEDMDIHRLLDGGPDGDLLQPFIAAKLHTLSEIFILGDEKTYNGYSNKRLQDQQEYRCFVLAELTGHQYVSLPGNKVWGLR
ncbi:Receptor-type tyrosine-protein phosphatase F [Oryzias melastigma]|uniref:protein-tyrosine-phosphatase n=1 Tax=Oryzias melastigma TaxID=30732 RepID=A0A834F1S9_ORYME|nr:Receptor-type tyrosine-protein phosphatase F [Oryzias melastigma]